MAFSIPPPSPFPLRGEPSPKPTRPYKKYVDKNKQINIKWKD